MWHNTAKNPIPLDTPVIFMVQTDDGIREINGIQLARNYKLINFWYEGSLKSLPYPTDRILAWKEVYCE